MEKSKKMKSFISLLLTFTILLVSMSIMSINVVAASCRCTNPSPSSRTISPTCTAQGYTETYCTRCGGSLSKSNYKAALGHSMQVTKNPTCSAAGTKKCIRCSYTESISATGNHSPATRTRTAATCTAAGTKETYCTACGKTLSTSSIPALGHNLTTTITKGATCGAVGTSTTRCTRCTYSVTNTIPATGNHNPATRTRTAATCTAAGTKETYCTVCNGILSTSAIPALGHSLEITKNATCGDTGAKKCARCSYTESIPATGNHNPATRTRTAATCTTAGTKETYCTVCNGILSTSAIPALGHSLEIIKNATCGDTGAKKCTRCSYTESIAETGNHSPDTRIKTPATCTKEGVKETYCKLCNIVLDTSSIPKTDHHLETIKFPTCGAEGTQKCVDCSYTQSVPATGNHSPDTRIKTPATCTEEGVKETYCKLCNIVLDTSSIPKTDHHLETIKFPTCGAEGTQKCVDCSYAQSIPATGNHSPDTRIKTPATCTEEGVKETYCKLCNIVLNTSPIPKTDHQLEIIKIATCETAGVKKCKNCSHTETVPATGNHSPDTRIKTPATCTEEGVKETYCKLCNIVLNTSSIPKTDHQLEIIKIATCETAGVKKCKNCSYTETVPATGNHSPDTRIKTPATCTEEGVKETYCKLCNIVLNTSSIPKTDHQLEIVKAAACGIEGIKKCKNCAYTESIPATGNHSPLTRITQLPTCTDKGKKETYCKLCNEVLSTASIDEYGHSLMITKAATCGAEGTKECKRAGCTYTEAIPITGNHDPSARTKTPATCTEKGIKETYCKFCNQVLSVNSIPSLDHQFQITINPTCGDEGIKECKRTDCTHTENIPATGNHNPARRTIKSATCTADGTYEVYCTLCNDVLTTGKIEASHDYIYTQVNKDVHCKACKRCKESEQENHNFEAGTCMDCGYFSTKDCDHPQNKRIRKTIAPTCMKDLTIEFWCEACNKRLESRVIYGVKGEHSLEWDVCDTKIYACGAKHMRATCTEPGCKYSFVSEKIVHPADSSPKGARRDVKKATCTTDGTYEVYCTVCNAMLSTGTIPAHHTADESTVNLPYFDWAAYEHQFMCKDCKKWFRVPHSYKYVSNYDGTHDYKCICGNIEKTEDCYLKESTVIKDNGYTKEIITTYSCAFCDYSREKTTYNHYKHNANITIDYGFEYGALRQHCVYCDDEHCEASYAAHVFACKDPERPADSIECVMCGISLIQAEADYDGPPYQAGGTDPFGWTNAYDFAPDDPESKTDAWDNITEFDPNEENVFFYLTNGKENYIIWNFKVAIKVDYFSAEELKKEIEKKYSLNNIIIIQP